MHHAFRAPVLVDALLVTTLSPQSDVKVLLHRPRPLQLQVQLLQQRLVALLLASSPAHAMKLLHSPRFAKPLACTH